MLLISKRTREKSAQDSILNVVTSLALHRDVGVVTKASRDLLELLETVCLTPLSLSDSSVTHKYSSSCLFTVVTKTRERVAPRTRTRYDVCRVMAAIFLWIPGFHYRPALCIRSEGSAQ